AEAHMRQGPATRFSEIDPIKILAEVDKYNLAEEIMALAKRYLPEPYYLRSQGLFRLNAMLAVSHLVISGESVINQEKILKLLN
ncbi:MAG: hypothetical protein PHF50_03845, partial [Patescibacteria group bacterium]|nr:hypothetical protein [Patescibacteria group bacterium]